MKRSGEALTGLASVKDEPMQGCELKGRVAGQKVRVKNRFSYAEGTKDFFGQMRHKRTALYSQAHEAN